VERLLAAGARVRGLVLPGEDAAALQAKGMEVVRGDVRLPETLQPLFAGLARREVVVIHTAGIIDISARVSPLAYEVNVGGTQNMVALALAHKVYRFIHVSSVHAIPEPRDRRRICETKTFSAEDVKGGYAKTKAEASQYVMDSVQRGLPAIIVHPSGIIGPGDDGNNHVVAAIKAYLAGKYPAAPRGGYDLVDVRDVAAACITAADRGRVGETYILSGTHYEFVDIFQMVDDITGKRAKPRPVVPTWMVRLAIPALRWHAQRKKEKALITSYSVDTLGSCDNFSHEKASRELDFWPRDIYVTLADTVAWLQRGEHGKQPRRKRRRRMARGTA